MTTTTNPLSILAWVGGGVAGAALTKEHRFAGGALGAILIGSISDVLIERRQAGLSIATPALLGGALTAVTLWAVTTAPQRHG